MIPEKIAPGLMAVLEDYQREGQIGLQRYMRSLGLVSGAGSPKPPRAVVFLHCEEKNSFAHLAAQGIRVNQAQGRLRTAFVPLEKVGPLSEEPAVERILPSRYLRLLMDIAPHHVHLPIFRTKNKLSGRGVLIGIIDSGIDPKHSAFKGRILRLWDQTLLGDGVPEGGYGAELTGSLLSISRDTIGHGTHVAGIAAGDDATYGGVAPAAELIVVKSSLQEAHIADAIRYVFRLAEELGRPAVINLSVGGHSDAHDGSDALSQIIDAESGPGRIVCCAAGNEGNDNIHAQIAVPQGATRTIRFRIPFSSGEDSIRVAALNGWYSGHDNFAIAVRSPGGFQTPYQGIITTGNPVKTYNLPDGFVRIATPNADPFNGDYNFLIEIFHPHSSLLPATPGTWRLRLRGVAANIGQIDVWALDNSQRYDVVFTGRSAKDVMKIGSPGAAASAITVAAYTTKVKWKDLQGNFHEIGMEVNDISDFSSEGPLRNGVHKPDVAAPGAMIASALSADSPVLSAYRLTPNYRIMAGTSMATPFITGLVALLLERDPSLDPARIKALLRKHSRIPGQLPEVFDPKWGYGLIDALEL